MNLNLTDTLPRFNRLTFAMLSTFLEVCYSPSLSDAAARLGTSKSSFSEACSSLKQILDLPLLERHKAGLYPNEQALFLVKYVLLLQNLEQFAQRIQVHTPTYVRLKIPARLWNASFTRHLSHALQACAQHSPQVLIWPELSGQSAIDEKPMHAETRFGELEPAWQPPWDELAQVNLAVLEKQQLSADQTIIAGAPWYVMSYDSQFLEGRQLSLNELPLERWIIPQMPWPFLHAAALFCTEHRIMFEQSNQEASALLREAPDVKTVIFINGLLLPETIHPGWHCTEVPKIAHMVLALQHDATLAITNVLAQALQEAWHTNPPLPTWQPNTSLKQWRYFAEILEKGSVSSAAQSLFLSQPALSMQLKQFEESLQTRVLERKTGSRQLQLNSAGQVIKQIQQGMWDVFNLLGQYCQQQRLQLSQSLLLGVLPSIDLRSRLLDIILNKVETWIEDHPSVRLEIIEERHHYLIHALRNQTLHLAITEAEAPWTVQLALDEPEEMGLVADTNLLRDPHINTLHWGDLEAIPLILPRRGSGMRLLIDAHCLQQGILVRPCMESDSLNINRMWILQGRYASILPRSALTSLAETNPNIRFISLIPRLDRVLRLTYLKNRNLNPIETQLIHFLLQRPASWH